MIGCFLLPIESCDDVATPANLPVIEWFHITGLIIKSVHGTARHVGFCQYLKGEVNEQGKVYFIIALLFSFIKIDLTILCFILFLVTIAMKYSKIVDR